MSLNPKQSAFVTEYLKDFNASKAAERAGYSKKTARSIGQKLLTKVDIQAEIARLQLEARSTAIMEYEEMCERLTRMARRNILDFMRPRGGIDLTKADAAVIQSIEQVQVNKRTKITKIRLIDPLKAMEQLAKLKGYYAPEQVSVTVNSFAELAKEIGYRPDKD